MSSNSSSAGIVLPTITGNTERDQAEIRHSLLALASNVQNVQNSISTTGTILQPLTSQISSNITFSVPSTSGTYSVYIPVQYLAAASGGPYILTLAGQNQSGGKTVLIPIAPSGDVILSGDLLFDIYVDSSKNIVTKAWEISGSNANGVWVLRHDGTAEAGKYRSEVLNITVAYAATWFAATATWTSPCTFTEVDFESVTAHISAQLAVTSRADTTPVLGVMTFYVIAPASVGTTVYETLFRLGRWRA
jgi:hypothetical protein